MMKTRLFAAAFLVSVGFMTTGSRAQDVTYADIHDTLNHGQVGTVRGYCLGTRTCNISDVSLAWINDGTPAVGFNMFKLTNERLTQIGMSWVKTACCVSNNTNSLCGTSCSAAGFGLRPHCMDTYSASFNTIQTNFSPRSGINPFAASFAPLTPQSGNAIFRRLQVAQTDLTTSGSQYFVDGVYVCTEEASMPTQRNNASYRRTLVNQTTFALTLQDTTQIGIPAIRAWRDHGLGANTPDTSVTVDVVDVPAEGRFWHACKVANLGGGLYRYDYAVYNINSDVAGGSFSVPIPQGATVSAIGFNAPLYHSGEPYSNAVWTNPATPCRVTWQSPQTFFENPNTNALRWGTMYNFWFTIDRPPVPGTVELGLFKPHSPQSVTFPAQVPQKCTFAMGDVDNNSAINGDDVSHFVDCLISGVSAGGDCNCADMDFTNCADTGDIGLFTEGLVSP
jgi:hypothetical protein